MVCGHGDVLDFCKDRDMVVCETWDGDIGDYKGPFCVLVTDQDMPEQEYYFQKGKLLGRGIELIHTRYKDDELMMGFLSYQAERRREKYGGRQPFGFYRKNGEVVARPETIAVAKKIIRMSDDGIPMRKIREDEEVRHPDGRKISISTIQQIIKNRNRYE